MSVTALKTEYKVNPLGIDVAALRLSWVLSSADRAQIQTAYRVIVAASENSIGASTGDVWDSQRTDSSRSVGVVYKGPALQSKKRYWWKVMAWDKNGQSSGWSDAAWFEMGLLNSSEWTGQWIGGDGSGNEAPYLRKEFTVEAGKTVAAARLYISACAYYEAYINGKRVGDHVLDPGFTVYDKSHLYVTHDVTSMIKAGINCIGAELGKGFYQVTAGNDPWGWGSARWSAEPRMLAQLEIAYVDGSSTRVVSDDTWRAADGPRYDNDIYTGDSYDARNEKPGWNTAGYDDAGWENAQNVGAPAGELRAQMQPPMKIVATIDPVGVASPEAGVFIFDFGVNNAGWEVLSASAPAGAKVRIKSGEWIKNGRVDANEFGIDYQVDNYTFKGADTEIWEPAFCYHGYRYVEVSGFPGTLTVANMKGRIVHSAVESAGAFSCSDNLFNNIHANVRRTIANNLHSIPTDCPIYEKNGWTGDAQLILETAMCNYDVNQFFTKWEYDGRDCQGSNGQVPLIWPSSEYGYRPDVEWTCAFIRVPYMLWRFYGDTKVMGELYSSMKGYANWNKNNTTFKLGDWLVPEAASDPDLTGRAAQCWELSMMKEMASELGYASDAAAWESDLTSKTNSFNSIYWNADSGYFRDANGFLQTNQVAPLAYGAVTDTDRKQSMLEALVKDVDSVHAGHCYTGCIGTKYFWPMLTENGYGEKAYIAAHKTDFPSYGEQINAGATTCWEGWGTAPRSKNHHFFGTIDQWFYEYLAGIKPAAPGFKSISVKPYVLGSLTSAAAELNTLYGRLASGWTFSGIDLVLTVAIPVNTSAAVLVPTLGVGASHAVIREGGTVIFDKGEKKDSVTGVHYKDTIAGRVVFTAGSGTYVFTATYDMTPPGVSKRTEFQPVPRNPLRLVRKGGRAALHVECPAAFEMRIFDALGKIRIQCKGEGSNTIMVSRSNIARGVFFVRFTTGAMVLTRKIMLP